MGDIAESVGHFILVVIQAPLPSAERVASAVEWTLDVSKRALTKSAREVYYYVQVRIVGARGDSCRWRKNLIE